MPHELVLHHYDLSPYAEKIRLCLGRKGLRWRSVQAPMVMPKPDLVELTGGYRRVPVLQLGADVYCDTHLIARVLDELHPDPAALAARPGDARACALALRRVELHDGRARVLRARRRLPGGVRRGPQEDDGAARHGPRPRLAAPPDEAHPAPREPRRPRAPARRRAPLPARGRALPRGLLGLPPDPLPPHAPAHRGAARAPEAGAGLDGARGRRRARRAASARSERGRRRRARRRAGALRRGAGRFPTASPSASASSSSRTSTAPATWSASSRPRASTRSPSAAGASAPGTWWCTSRAKTTASSRRARALRLPSGASPAPRSCGQLERSGRGATADG